MCLWVFRAIILWKILFTWDAVFRFQKGSNPIWNRQRKKEWSWIPFRKATPVRVSMFSSPGIDSMRPHQRAPQESFPRLAPRNLRQKTVGLLESNTIKRWSRSYADSCVRSLHGQSLVFVFVWEQERIILLWTLCSRLILAGSVGCSPGKMKLVAAFVIVLGVVAVSCDAKRKRKFEGDFEFAEEVSYVATRERTDSLCTLMLLLRIARGQDRCLSFSVSTYLSSRFSGLLPKPLCYWP